MSTDRLKLYNSALVLCGETRLASLEETREARYELDVAWDNDLVRTCLEMGQWNFAMRAIELPYTGDLEGFGYAHAFEKPEDLIRVAAVCSDENFTSPLLKYFDEADYWFSDLETIYVRYVSDDNEYGMDFAKWPMSFARLVEAYLADRVVAKLTGGDEKRIVRVKKELRDAKASALSKDALADPASFPPPGTWVSSRRGNSNRDPSGGQLIG